MVLAISEPDGGHDPANQGPRLLSAPGAKLRAVSRVAARPSQPLVKFSTRNINLSRAQCSPDPGKVETGSLYHESFKCVPPNLANRKTRSNRPMADGRWPMNGSARLGPARPGPACGPRLPHRPAWDGRGQGPQNISISQICYLTFHLNLSRIGALCAAAGASKGEIVPQDRAAAAHPVPAGHQGTSGLPTTWSGKTSLAARRGIESRLLVFVLTRKAVLVAWWCTHITCPAEERIT